MALSISNLGGTLAAWLRSIGSTSQPGAGEGILGVHAEDLNGNPLAVAHGQETYASQFGFLSMGQNDGNALAMRVDRMGGIAVSAHTPLFMWNPEGTTINTRILAASALTMAPTQTAATGLQLNPALSTAVNTYAMYTSRQQFQFRAKQPLLYRIKLRPATVGLNVANTGIDFGFGAPTTNAAPANGAVWRIDGSGVMPVVYINGFAVQTGDSIAGLLSASKYYIWDIIKDDDAYIFTCQDQGAGKVVSRQVIQIPSTQAKGIAASHLPVFFRVYTGATIPSNASNAFVTDVYVALLDAQTNQGPGQFQTGAAGFGSETSPTTFAASTNLANSAVAPTITLSNTSPGAITLDGGVRFSAPVSALTDYTLFGFTVPAPHRLRSRGVVVSAKNLGAAVATTATQIDFFLGIDGATSLASTAKRKYLGTQTFPIGAAIGAAASEGPLIVDLSAADIISESASVVHLIARISTGTATASQVIEVMYDHIGHFE